MKKKTTTGIFAATPSASELRKDIVSGDWVLIATGRARRPQDFIKERQKSSHPVSSCPFEDPQKSNGELALVWYPAPDSESKNTMEDWFVQAVPNKYPALIPHKGQVCPTEENMGIHVRRVGMGYHEVIITRKHDTSLGQMNAEEVELVVRAYRERYAALKKDNCIEYILIFHNHGVEAGASISHPHSQLIAFPIVPPDVQRSFEGSAAFYKKHHACIHCYMLEEERKDKKRVIYENEDFIAIAPYASRVSFELRIYPKAHEPRFELISERNMQKFAEALREVLGKLHKALKDPAYNFFIHTTPVSAPRAEHYHWHLEILPKTATWAGLELGTGVDVVVALPEDVPEILS